MPKGAGARGGSIVGELSIRERPAEAEDRAVPGHWEGDLLCGSNGSQIATLVERHSRFVMLHEARRTRTASASPVRWPARSSGCRRSCAVRWRGTAASRWPRIGSSRWRRDVQVYFCDPYSPWQRGSNENTNGLLRPSRAMDGAGRAYKGCIYGVSSDPQSERRTTPTNDCAIHRRDRATAQGFATGRPFSTHACMSPSRCDSRV